MVMADWLVAQLKLAAASIGAGLLLGFLYWLYRLGQQRRGRRPYKCYRRSDLVFSLLATLLLVLFWFSVTDGSFNMSAVIKLWCGFCLFVFVFAPRLMVIHRKKALTRPAPKKKKNAASQNSRAGSWQHGNQRKGRHKNVPSAQQWAERSALLILNQWDKQQMRRKERLKKKAQEDADNLDA